MPRQSRIDAPASIHHIIIRGIEGSPLFRRSTDYENFLARFAARLSDTSTTCYAWALMKNHVHLLIRSGLVPISTLMRRLLTGYALQFNRRYSRSGHLFQNRYKSFLCEEHSYLLELIRYIHLNPVRAGVTKDMVELEKFPWCGHGALLGVQRREWQDTAFVLSLFNKQKAVAKRRYAAFVEKGIALGRRPDLTGGGLIRSAGGWTAVQALGSRRERFASDERILGSSDFVRKVLKQANEEYETKASAVVKGLDIERLIAIVCEQFGLNRALLTTRVRQRAVARARAIICHLAFDKLYVKGIHIAQKLNLTPGAVSLLATRGRTDSLAEKIEKIFYKEESQTLTF